MRVFGFRLPFFVAAVWVSIGSTVWALSYGANRVETVYTSSLTVPTSYVVSSSWVQPAAYVVPQYYSTAYLADPIAVVQPSYVTTAYVRRGLFGRRWLVERPLYARDLATSYYVPTSYYRTTSYIPTVSTNSVVWPSEYVGSADCVCPGLVASAASPVVKAQSSATAPRTDGGSQTIESKPAEEPAMDSNVGPAPGVTDNTPPAPTAVRQETQPGAEPTRPAAGTPTVQPNPNSSTTSPVRPAPAAGSQGGTPKGQSGATEAQGKNATGAGSPTGTSQVPTSPLNNNLGVPTAPDGGPPVTLPPDPGPLNNTPTGEGRYEARRPVFSTPAIRPEFPNVLQGFVQSRAGGQREEGVRVSISDPLNPTREKTTVTDAFGRFAIKLTDGNWTVNVTMPSGRVYAVSQVHVSNGLVSDTQGRRVPRLEITR